MRSSVQSFLLVAGLLVAASAVAQPRAAEMEGDIRAWVGKTYTEYVSARGAPKITTVAQDGAKQLEYVQERILNRLPTTNTQVTMVNMGNGAMVPVTQVSIEPGSVLTFTCKLIVNFSNKDILESWKVEGNDC